MQLAVENSLRGRLTVAAFLLGIGLASLLLAVQSVRIAMTARLGKSSRIVDIRKAVSMDPANPELHYQLGTAETYSLENSDAADGIQQFQLATELSPRGTRYWRALASACQSEGDIDCTTHAVARTLALSPMTPRVHWEAANYYLWANRQELALRQFRLLLEIDPGYAGATFRVALGATGSPEIVDREVLPSAARPELRLAYLTFLSTHGEEDAAFQVWKDVVANKSAFKLAVADPYLEHLIGTRKYGKATTVWQDLESRGIVRQPSGDDSGNLVFNGGFELLPLNAGFDWRYHMEPYVAVDFKDLHAGAAKSCLRLDFSDVENHQDEPVYQLVPVMADQTYRLTAQVRSDNITSDSGPRLRVIDPACAECLNASSDAIVGTTSWHKVTLQFRTGPDTRLVRLSVWRARSLDYPTEIIGTLWLRGISIRAVAPQANQVAQRQGI